MARLVTSRRQVLRGAFASLALPFLHSALPRAAWATTPAIPKRVLWYFMPNGMLMDAFTPPTEGSGFTLSFNLELLADIQHRMTVISGLSNVAAKETPTFECPHGLGTASVLTDVAHGGSNLRAGVSIDQVIANAIGHETPFPSMQLANAEPSLACNGNECVYRDHVSWATATTPLTPLTSPVVLFERMFGAGDALLTEEQAAARLLLRTSVLDAVELRSSPLKTQLGAADAAKLDEYLTGVRELEVRIQQLAAMQCTPSAKPPPGAGFPQAVALMTELIVKAYECDMTRVITYMLAQSTATTSYDFIGVNSSHHTTSHHLNRPDTMSDLSKIQRWGLDRFGDIARGLAAIQEADGSSVLDHTMMMLATDLEDPNQHLWDNMPALVLGGEAGGIVQGRHLRVPNQPHSNLWLTALEFVGQGDLSFGTYATEPVSLS